MVRDNIDLLKKTIAENGLENIQINEVALGKMSGEIALRTSPSDLAATLLPDIGDNTHRDLGSKAIGRDCQ